MSIFERSEWIWISESAGKDEYAEFFTELYIENGATVRLSVDGDYTLYVNGIYAASNQYGDYEHYKIYDEIDITPFALKGRNAVSILVWHPGEKSSRYAEAAAGLIFEIFEKENLLAYSSPMVLARKSPVWKSGRCKKITRQLGYGFAYDSTADDGAFFTGEGFSNSVAVNKNCRLFPRPTEKLRLAESPVKAHITSSEDGKYHLSDLLSETVGILHLRFTSSKEQTVRISWGEHLTDGKVRRIIGERDFSVEYTAKKGYNEFTAYMLRFGARYIELTSDEPTKPDYIGIISQYYPVDELYYRPTDPQDRDIYELCLSTLRLSMMEHYVDCPWREQALYAYDSRNQMLAGYYAFENGNRDYVAANLRLLSEDIRSDGLLPIVSPTSDGRAIPSFNLHYFMAVREYLEQTGDISLVKELYPRLITVMDAMTGNMRDGLLDRFSGYKIWNFYEWIPELSGDIENSEPCEPDSIINFLFILALDSLYEISEALGLRFPYSGLADSLRRATDARFYDSRTGLYSFKEGDGVFTELAASLAILSRTAVGDRARSVAESIVNGKTIPATLSMKCFTYDACLFVDPAYRDYVLSDIRTCWGYMLSQGATSAWETLKGDADFDGAGSLCHGWNAIPIVYYHRLGMLRAAAADQR